MQTGRWPKEQQETMGLSDLTHSLLIFSSLHDSPGGTTLLCHTVLCWWLCNRFERVKFMYLMRVSEIHILSPSMYHIDPDWPWHTAALSGGKEMGSASAGWQHQHWWRHSHSSLDWTTASISNTIKRSTATSYEAVMQHPISNNQVSPTIVNNANNYFSE